MKTIIIPLLIAALMWIPCQSANSDPPPPDDHPILIAACAILVIGIGGCAVVEINKLCNKIPKPDTNSPPTVPPIPTNPPPPFRTNAPKRFVEGDCPTTTTLAVNTGESEFGVSALLIDDGGYDLVVMTTLETTDNFHDWQPAFRIYSWINTNPVPQPIIVGIYDPVGNLIASESNNLVPFETARINFGQMLPMQQQKAFRLMSIQ